MPTTSNFGWTTPADTDLVKDGAAAIRTLGNGIDTSFLDLKGGTTGQVLSKASNTDLDFTWTADASGIPATIFDAKGDIIAATAADTASRLAVGANNTVLTADSTTATGLKWATPSAGPTGWSLLNAGGTALTGATSITISGISAKQILVFIDAARTGATFSVISVRPNNISTNDYSEYGIQQRFQSTYTVSDFDNVQSYSGASRIRVGQQGASATSLVSGTVYLDLADQTGWKRWTSWGSGDNTGATDAQRAFVLGGVIEMSAAITSITVVTDGGSNFDAGTVYVLGAN